MRQSGGAVGEVRDLLSMQASEAVSQLGWGSRVRFAAVNSRAFHDLAERSAVIARKGSNTKIFFPFWAVGLYWR
eukprot:903780-Amphidinium_carterae.1